MHVREEHDLPEASGGAQQVRMFSQHTEHGTAMIQKRPWWASVENVVHATPQPISRRPFIGGCRMARLTLKVVQH